MLRSSLIAAVVAASSVASAQPVLTPSVPPPYQYQPRPTEDEREILNHGEISHVGRAAVIAAFVGFGAGEYDEGRWHETGWIFTTVDSVAAATMVVAVGGIIASISKCLTLAGPGDDTPACDNTNIPKGLDPMEWVFLGGALLRVISSVGQVIDVTAGAHVHDQRFRALRDRYGLRNIAKTITPYVERPQSSDRGMTAGIALRF